MAKSVHELIAETLARHVILDAADIAAIHTLPFDRREFAASTYLVREGQQPRACFFLLDGYVYRQKLTADGGRSIVALRVVGDFVDLQNIYLPESDHDVLALTAIVAADIPLEALHALVRANARIAQALWKIGLIEASIFREWLLNLARRNAQVRLAHLLCEFSTRLSLAGLARMDTYELPMTQEQLGDALGLTSVHVNRVLKALEKDGLIRRRKREVTIMDWHRLRRFASFNDRYLHIGQSAGIID